MKKILLPLAILAFGMLGAEQAKADSVTLSLSSQTVTLGNTANITLGISGLGNGTALGAFDVNIAFSSNILGFSSVTYGDPHLGDQLNLEGFGTITTTTPGIGAAELFELSLDSPSVLASSQAASFTLATLTFNTLALGQSPLSISINALSDQNGSSLNAGTTDGSVTVNPSTVVTPEPSSILLFGAGLGLLINKARSLRHSD